MGGRERACVGREGRGEASQAVRATSCLLVPEAGGGGEGSGGEGGKEAWSWARGQEGASEGGGEVPEEATREAAKKAKTGTPKFRKSLREAKSLDSLARAPSRVFAILLACSGTTPARERESEHGHFQNLIGTGKFL